MQTFTRLIIQMTHPMTKNSDEIAFEEWFKEFSYSEYPFTEEEWEVFKKDSLSMKRARSGWQAAIAHERKRSEKLVKALKDIEHTKFIFMTKRGVPKFISEHVEKALQEYQAREEWIQLNNV
jgi:hypothetical protein